MFSKIIFSSHWYYVIICFLSGLILAALLYYKNRKNADVPKGILYGMFIFRFLGITTLVLLLLNVFLKQTVNETQNPVILIAVDNSRSMVESKDSSYIKNQFVKNLDLFKKNIGRNFTVKTILFGGNSKATEKDPDFSEKETDINNLLNDIENNYSNQNVGALVLVSDGIYNKGANPVHGAEKPGYPIFTVALGDTSELRDVILQKVNHNQFAYLGNNFPVEAVIAAKKYSGKELTVTLLKDGVKKGEQKIKVSSDNFLSTVSFTLNADKGGIQKYSVNVSVLEGEKTIHNNSQSFLIDIIDNRYKVLLLAGVPHPDVSAINEVIANNPAYELEYSLTSEFKKTLKPYTLVIIHGYSNSQASIVNECRNNKIPFWIINPVSTENLPGIKISASLNKQNDAEPFLNASFGLFSISDELKGFIKDLPAIKTFFGNYSFGPGTNTLIYQKIGVVETENPVLFFSDLNDTKSAIFIGDGLWRWKMRDYAEHNNLNLFTELISKTMQYLSIKADKSFFRITAPRVINENEPVELRAEVYNKSYELTTVPEVSLTVINPEKKQFNSIFSKTEETYKLNLGFLQPGEYRYDAKVKVNGDLYSKQGVFVVKEILAEKINTVANHQLLYQLANKSGGKMFYPDELEKMGDTILTNKLIKPITYSANETRPVIDLKWIFFLVLILLSVEWFFRKRYFAI